ncbi:MAG: hypothetical protein AVDCRST_MAG52-2775, partial [uncultured Blastococcus sp.]
CPVPPLTLPPRRALPAVAPAVTGRARPPGSAAPTSPPSASGCSSSVRRPRAAAPSSSGCSRRRPQAATPGASSPAPVAGPAPRSRSSSAC